MDPVSLGVLLALGLGAVLGTVERVRQGSKPNLWLYNGFDKVWRKPRPGGRDREQHSEGEKKDGQHA